MLGTKADDNRQGANQYNQSQNNTVSTPSVSVANEPEIDEPGGDEDLPF